MTPPLPLPLLLLLLEVRGRGKGQGEEEERAERRGGELLGGGKGKGSSLVAAW